ncbi:MAG: tyrosine-type recombinase/integrase, partial [Longicatena sp.]
MNEDLIDNFLQHISLTNTGSENTLLAYRQDIQQFLEFEDNIEKVDRECITSYILYLREAFYLNNRSVCRKLSTLRSFFRWLMQNHYIMSSPFINFKNPKTNSKIPDFLFLDELEMFFDGIPTDKPVGVRNRVMFELMYASGLRVSEATSLTLDNIDMESCLLRVTGKGNKERLIPFYDNLQPRLSHYISTIRPQLTTGISSPYLFINRYGEKLSSQGVNFILKELDASTGLNRNLH